MKTVLHRAKIFLLAYVVFFIIAGIMLILFNKETIHIIGNKMHAPCLDVFFKYMTYLGDGLVIIPVVIILIFIRFRFAIIATIAYLTSGLLVQIFKRFIFEDCFRPVKYFRGRIDLHLIEGVKVHGNHSFPSGHTTTAFAVFLCLAMFVRPTYLKILFFLAALLVAVSRVYLSQHFVIDVWAGSLLGVIFALLAYYSISGISASWMDKSLLK